MLYSNLTVHCVFRPWLMYVCPAYYTFHLEHVCGAQRRREQLGKILKTIEYLFHAKISINSG